MKKVIILIVVLMFIALCLNVFAQESTYPFEAKVSGSGEKTVIFIPGFACSGEVWNSTRAFFEKDFTCHTLTMAGFAGVPAQPAPSFQSWETAIATYIRDKKIDRPVVVGHSMGGALAMALAADYPALVSGIIVVDALPCLPALMDPSFQTRDNNDCSTFTATYTAMPDAQFRTMQQQAIPQLLADTSKHQLVTGWSVKSDRTTFAEMYCDFSNTDLREKIAHVRCPSLVLLQSYFSNFKPVIHEQYRKLETANIQYATRGLHFIMYDDPQWYEQQVTAFIKQGVNGL